MPQWLAGMRIEPAWSPPIAISTSLAATSAAQPEEEPPALKPLRRGLCTGPLALVWLPPEKQKYSQTVLPTIVPPAIENARRHRRIDIRHIAFEGRGAVHHWHAREADIVLQRHRFAGKLARSGAGHLGFDVPGAERVILRWRPAAGPARVGNGRQLVRHPVEDVVALEARPESFQMGRKIGLAETEAKFGCHLAELCQCGDLYGAEGHGCCSFRCQQVVARSILIDDCLLTSHFSAQNAVPRLELAHRARDGDSRPTGQRLRRPQRGAARLWEPEHLRTAASIIATYLSSHTPSRRLPLKMLLTRQSAIRLPAGNAAERYRPTRLGKPAGCSFIEPHLFHAPAVVDRVDLNSDALDVGVPAGRRAVVVD